MRRMPRGYKCQLQGTNERTRVGGGGRMSACLLRSRLRFASLSEGGDARASSSRSPPIGEWSLNKGNARKNDSLTAAASSQTKAETMNTTTTTTCVCAVSIRKECNYGNEVAQEPSFHGGETTHPISFSSDFTICGRAAGCRIASLLAQHRYVESVRIELDGN